MPLDDPTFSSPKRKRDDQPQPPPTKKLSPVRLETKIPSSPLAAEDDTGSPRTKIAYRFKGLDIGGGGVPTFELGESANLDGAMNLDDNNSASKRLKIFGNEDLEIPETPQVNRDRVNNDLSTNASLQTAPNGLPLSGEVDPVVFKGMIARSSASKLVRSYPSINRLADSKSRGRKRMGTPPLVAGTEMDAEVTIVDPDRAALTWHDDEITGHDPDDPDDDGEGINGIGFKPTPAIAYARAEMRKKQLADYRSRESREARAKRNERRRGSPGLSSASREEEAARRVRFMEAEANSMIITS